MSSLPDKWGGEWFVNVGRALRELAKMRQERDKGWDSRCQRLVDWAIDIEQLTPPSAIAPNIVADARNILRQYTEGAKDAGLDVDIYGNQYRDYRFAKAIVASTDGGTA